MLSAISFWFQLLWRAITLQVLLSAPGLVTDHISDDWLFAFVQQRLAEPRATKLLLHLLVCEECCKLANLHHDYQQIAQEALGDQGEE